MIQAIFLALLLITLLAGSFAYFNPKPKQFNPLGYMMESSGYDTVMTSNLKKTQQIDITTGKGLVKVRRLMDDIAFKQNEFLDALQDQQNVLKNANKDVQSVLREAQEHGQQGNQDILQLEALSSQMQDEERLLVSRGQYIVGLNDRLKQNRALLAEELDLQNANTESSRESIQQRYDELQTQANDLFDKIDQHNQQVAEQMHHFSNRLSHMASTVNELRLLKARDDIERMMDKEREQMQRVAENEQLNRDHMDQAQDVSAASQQKMEDAMQRTQEIIDQERQKEEDRRLAGQ